MGGLLQFLEGHAGLIIIILLAVLVLELMIQLLGHRNGSNGMRKGQAQGTEEYCREIAQNGQDVFILIQRENHQVAYVSSNMERNLGLKCEDVSNDIRCLEKIAGRKCIRHVNQKLNEWDGKSALDIEISYQKLGDDKKRRGILFITPTEDGRFILCVISDTTKEYEKRKKLENEIEKALQSDESKTRFLSQMSHEIRTPMNGMLGMISLAKMNMENRSEAEDYLEKAEGLSKFLLSIINDILDMSRIESGKIELAHEKVDLFALSEKLKNMFQVTVEDKGVKFVLEMLDFNVRYIMGDELRISQVLANFLSNSSKFTPAGGQITLTFRQMHVIDGKVNVMMRVRDTGKGMSPEFMSRIFNPFEQEDATVARKYGGSGLGMAISDSLIRLMGGQITVDSELGKGSEFTVFLELPLAQGDQTLPGETENVLSEEAEAEAFSIEGFRILLAEDNKVNAIIATKLLAAQGAVVENAVNGAEALRMFEEQEPGYYQIILMDIQMPEMNGWEATQAIRALERTDAKMIPILALSADAFVEDKRKSVAMGMNGHVSKPIDFMELKKVMKDVMS